MATATRCIPASSITRAEAGSLPLDEHWLDYAKPRAELMVISPEIAAKILDERNGDNRRVAPYRVKMIASELASGRWKVNGETIIFDAAGALKNGQHRLTACVQAGVPLRTWVVFGVDPGCFDTLDRGRNRKTSDDMAILGEKYYNLLPAALGLIWLDERDQIEMAGTTTSSQELQEVLAHHPGIREHVAWVSSKKVTSLLNPSIAAFLRYRFSQRDADAAALFFDDLKDGINLDAGDPVLLLRNRMMDNRAAKAKLKKVDILALVIKAWNARRAGKAVRFLAWKSTEDFPGIL